MKILHFLLSDSLHSGDKKVLKAVMSSDRRRGRGRGAGGGGGDGGGGGRVKKPVINTDDPVQKMFGEISLYLDSRHDKREKLVKLSRDITIESKRIIFCLHRFDSSDL